MKEIVRKNFQFKQFIDKKKLASCSLDGVGDGIGVGDGMAALDLEAELRRLS